MRAQKNDAGNGSKGFASRVHASLSKCWSFFHLSYNRLEEATLICSMLVMLAGLLFEAANPVYMPEGAPHIDPDSTGMQLLTYATVILIVLPVAYFIVLMARIVLSMCHRDKMDVTMDAAKLESRNIKSSRYSKLLEARLMLAAMARGYSFPTVLLLYDEPKALEIGRVVKKKGRYCWCRRKNMLKPHNAVLASLISSAPKRADAIERALQRWDIEKPQLSDTRIPTRPLPRELMAHSYKVTNSLLSMLQPSSSNRTRRKKVKAKLTGKQRQVWKSDFGTGFGDVFVNPISREAKVSSGMQKHSGPSEFKIAALSLQDWRSNPVKGKHMSTKSEV